MWIEYASEQSMPNVGSVIETSQSADKLSKGRPGLRFQPVDATHSLNFSAGE